MKYSAIKIKLSLLALALLLVAANTSQAQSRFSTKAFEKNHPDIKKVYSKLTQPFGDSIIRINLENQNIALGTVVDKNGLIVTKASEIEDREIKCVIEGKDFDAEILATDETMDLALLKVDASNLKPIEFDAKADDVQSGKFVVSVDYDAEPESIGVITVQPRRFRSTQRRNSSRPQGFLGVGSDANPDGDGVVVGSVSTRSAASRARIRRGDIILEISGEKTNSRNQLSSAIKKHKPGDLITVKILRGDRELELEAKLDDFRDQANAAFDQWGGGPFSKRRFNFPAVIAHDSVIKPHKMGGPLVNSDGKVLGINIARALRVSTYAIPGDKVMEFVKKHKNDKPTSKSSNK